MTFVLSKPQQELKPLLMTQIGGSSNNHNGSTIPPLSVAPNWSGFSHAKRRTRLRRKPSLSRWCFSIGLAVLVVLLLFFPYLLRSFDQLVDATKTQIKQHNTNIRAQKNQQPLLSGTTSDSRIAYYHQASTTPSARQNYHAVLLHGAAFTKEDWKTSGILEKFRIEYPSVAVTALDLPVSAGHEQLEKVLLELRNADLIETLPVSAIVTPSASGKSVTSWIREEQSEGLGDYTRLWIPVASYSVNQCSPEDLRSLGRSGVGVLAVHGDKDRKGSQTSDTLVRYAGATKLELPGRHPVYLDSPDAFVEAVGEAILAQP